MCVCVPQMNSIWHASFPMSLFGSVRGAADGPSSASAHVVANESFRKEISLLVIIPNPSGFFFHAITRQCYDRKQAYFTSSMAPSLRHLRDMLNTEQ